MDTALSGGCHAFWKCDLKFNKSRRGSSLLAWWKCERVFVASHLYFITFIIFPRDQYVDKTPTNTGRVAIQSNRTEINPQTNVANACNSEAFEEMAAPCIIPSSHPSLDLNDDYWLMRQNSGRAAVQNNKFEINPGQNAANIGWVTFIVLVFPFFSSLPSNWGLYWINMTKDNNFKWIFWQSQIYLLLGIV